MSRRLRPLRQAVEVAALHALGLLARAIPFRAASALGAVLGEGAAAFLARRRRIAVENIRAALGDRGAGESAEALARRAFRQMGRSFLEFLALPSLGPRRLLERVELLGYEPVYARVREGKGSVLVTGHFGNWELLGAAVRASGVPVRYLLPEQTNQGSDRYFDSIRRAVGIEPIKIGFGIRNELRALREGGVVGMLPDQDARKVGIHVPFFGRPASTHTGPARLAWRTGCPIGIGIVERIAGCRFRSRLVALLEPDTAADEEAEVRRLTTELTARIEEAIRRRPDHWYWIHRRWKTPPTT